MFGELKKIYLEKIKKNFLKGYLYKKAMLSQEIVSFNRTRFSEKSKNAIF